MKAYNFLQVTIENGVSYICLNNQKKANALNRTLWFEIGQVFDEISKDENVKVCVLSGNGKHFSSGIDLNFLTEIMDEVKKLDDHKRQEYLYAYIKKMQEAFSSVERCRKPIIAAIHGACIGAAVDLISACDMRFSTMLTSFSIMETRLGIVADMGTLQRLRFVMNDGRLKELALSSKIFNAFQAKKWGLVNEVYCSKAKLMREVKKLAKALVTLPDYAVQGTKNVLNHGRNQSIDEGLDAVAKLNSHLFLTEKSKEVFLSMQKSINK